MSPSLSVVSDNKVGALPRSEALSTRVRRLQAEAKGLAREHVAALIAALHETEALCAEIAEGGEAYPPGIRDIARRLAEEVEAKVATIEAINSRN
ncbi:hypothetical protein [Phenylobacterium sp.]|uniref:hypothetical protein n=1 Tax=Phenylobacterium sp. TaxID=1871053 RepID=UPI0030F3BC48